MMNIIHAVPQESRREIEARANSDFYNYYESEPIREQYFFNYSTVTTLFVLKKRLNGEIQYNVRLKTRTLH